MDGPLTKLRPDRDLQCYFQQPSAVAALSETSASGFTVSGCWRQQFDWAVIEWNRDNVFEHPQLRNLPDGDLSSLTLTYQETRENCIPIDSTLYPTVDWPYLRLWAEEGYQETLYEIPLKRYAAAVGDYAPATAQFQLQGTITGGDYIELAWLDQHFNYFVLGTDTLDTAVTGLAGAITANVERGQVSATADGATITLTWVGTAGANGNRIGVYGTVHGAQTETWEPSWAVFGGGESPQTWQIAMNFASLEGYRDPDRTTLVAVPTSNVRKIRWTWAADLQPGAFQRSEFSIVVKEWTVNGTGAAHRVAGPGSRRIENTCSDLIYTGRWIQEIGNYSGGSIHHSTTNGDSICGSYSLAVPHILYLGTRYLGPDTAAKQNLKYEVTVQVDSNPSVTIDLKRPGEDILFRYPLGQFAGTATHSFKITNSGDGGADFYFDFLEAAVPATTLPQAADDSTTTLATDWDTEHSLAIAPERTAWLIRQLGFRGRANHYAGALWFYELTRPGNRYASATVTFSGAPEFGKLTSLTVGGTPIQHVNLIGDTAERVAKCFELLLNSGWTGIRAEAAGAVLTITARAMGTDGNGISLSMDTGGSTTFSAQTSGPHLSEGIEASWVTDTIANPRMNRAVRDWHRSYFRALAGYGITATAAFSMELGNGDDSVGAGIAQRYPDGSPVWVNTPALQTNFSPASLAFWQQVYADMAGVMADAGMTPYLQFGEVQWWYFASHSGMPFYDAYTAGAFQASVGRPLGTIASEHVDPANFAAECSFLPTLIGQFTNSIMTFVRAIYPATKFEVLYAPDTNDTPLNRLINFPVPDWTPAKLASLKTENFTYTGDRNLDKARQSIALPGQFGFAASQTSHLIGIGDSTTAWSRERRLVFAAGLESAVLFALDQFCLVGYGLPLERSPRRSRFMGA